MAKASISAAEKALLAVTDRFHIDDTPDVHASYISSVSRQKRYEWGDLGLIIVDYLHIMRLDNGDLVNTLGRATKDLRALGKELGCPVILLSQLSRQPEKSDGKKVNRRPQLSDLRASGEIEQTADAVIFLYRDSYYEQPGLAPEDDVIEVIVAKHRNGPPGMIRLRWLPRYMKFENR
jgi:replicative DNA helicase